MASIQEKAVLVSLTMSCWINSVRDEKSSKDVEQRNHAERGAVRAKKVLTKPETLKPVKGRIGALQAHWREHTLPWTNDGVRLLPAVKFQSFFEKARELEQDYWREVGQYCANYPRMLGEARNRLGSLYDEREFPSANRIKDKFGCRLRTEPIPEATSDFRVHLSKDEVERVRRDVEETVKEGMRIAMSGLVERLQETLALFAKRMKQDDVVLRDSLLANIREIIGEVDAFNVVDDKRIAALKKATEEALKGVDLEALRKDKKARKAMADKADKVLAQMAGYIGEMGVEK